MHRGWWSLPSGGRGVGWASEGSCARAAVGVERVGKSQGRGVSDAGGVRCPYRCRWQGKFCCVGVRVQPEPCPACGRLAFGSSQVIALHPCPHRCSTRLLRVRVGCAVWWVSPGRVPGGPRVCWSLHGAVSRQGASRGGVRLGRVPTRRRDQLSAVSFGSRFLLA